MKNGELNLIELLNRVPNQNSCFVKSIAVLVKNYQIADEVRSFLLDNPNAKADEVQKYIYDELIED